MTSAAGASMTTASAGERGLQIALATALVLSVALPAAFAGAAGAWALPGFDSFGWTVVGRALAVIGVCAACLWSIDCAAERLRHPVARAFCWLALTIPMVVVFYWLGPTTHIGDWDWVMGFAERGKTFGRWYGAALLYGAFHRLLRPAGFIPLDSVRACSAVCGALCAGVYALVMRRLGATRVLRAWPFLYLSAFGLVGISLAHVELYAGVSLVIAVAVWAGVAVLQCPTWERVLCFSVATGAAMVTYATGAFLLPGAVGVLAWIAWRAISERRAALGGSVVAGVVAVPLLVALVDRWGPRAQDVSPLGFWMSQHGSRIDNLAPPPFHPPGVLWPVFPSLIRPQYWFSAWHLRDLGCHLYLDDRAGIAIVLALLIGGITALLRRAPHPFTRPVLFLLVCTVLYGAYGFTEANMRAEPWDWDVWSHAALLISLLAGALLAAAAQGTRYGAGIEALVIALGLASQLAGMHFLMSYAREPTARGPAVAGLRLAVTPERVEILADGQPLAPLWFWIYNDGEVAIDLAPTTLRFEFGALDGDQVRFAMPSLVRTVLGSRRVPPHGFACVADVLKLPSSLRLPSHIRAAEALRPPRERAGVLRAQFMGDPARPPLVLTSNPLQFVVRDPPEE